MTESLLSDLLANEGATPQTISRSHLRAMSAGLLEIIDLVFPPDERDGVKARLQALLTEPESRSP